MRILHLEDAPTDAVLVRSTLAGDGVACEIRPVELRADFQAALAQGGFDLILSDYHLPSFDGLEALEMARRLCPLVPFIFVSGAINEEQAIESLRNGATDYVFKHNLVRLAPAVRRALHEADERRDRERAEEALRELSGHLLRSQDEERRRIARELHDTTAQNLAAVSMNLALLKRALPDLQPASEKILADTLALTERATMEIRTLSYLLHPPLLDEVGLASALRDYAAGFAKRSGIRVAVEVPPHLGRLPGVAELALFRVVQESLGNIHRHSGSPTALIRLEREAGSVRLEVCDAGRGLPSGKRRGLGVGIAGMRERMRQLGGRLEVESSPRGTTIRAILPLNETAPAAP